MNNLALLSILALTTAACGGSSGDSDGALAFGTAATFVSPNGAVIPDEDSTRVEFDNGTVYEVTFDEDDNYVGATLNGKPVTDARYVSINIPNGTDEGGSIEAIAAVNGTDGLVFVESDLELNQDDLEADGFTTLAGAGVLAEVEASKENLHIDGIEYIYVLNNSGMTAGSKHAFNGKAEISADGSFSARLGDVNIDGSISGYNITGDASLADMDGTAQGIIGINANDGYGASIGTFSGGNTDNGFAGGWFATEE